MSGSGSDKSLKSNNSNTSSITILKKKPPTEVVPISEGTKINPKKPENNNEPAKTEIINEPVKSEINILNEFAYRLKKTVSFEVRNLKKICSNLLNFKLEKNIRDNIKQLN